MKYSIKYTFNYLNLFHRGVVSVTMDLLKVDVNQCEDEYNIPNRFKETNKCDEKSSYVS